MLTRDDADIKVARGAALLDRVKPGWCDRIDPHTLKLHDPCGCIIGQLCHIKDRESFAMSTVRLLDIRQLEPTSINAIAAQHGFDFDAYAGGTHADYAVLQDAWIAAIAARKFPVSEGADAPATPVDAVATPMESPQADPSRERIFV